MSFCQKQKEMLFYIVFSTNCLHLKGITVPSPSSVSCPDSCFCMKGHWGRGVRERGHSLPSDSFKSLTLALSARGCQVVTRRSEKGHGGAGASAERRREFRALARAKKEWEGCPMSPLTPRMRAELLGPYPECLGSSSVLKAGGLR